MSADLMWSDIVFSMISPNSLQMVDAYVDGFAAAADAVAVDSVALAPETDMDDRWTNPCNLLLN